MPRTTACLTDASPASGSQRHTRLARQDVRDQPQIAESKRRPPRRPVEHRTSVAGAVRGDPCNFEGQSIIEKSCDRPTDNGNAANTSLGVTYRQTELVAANYVMVPVMLLNKRVRVD
jgi:hypothetical protein